MFSEFEDSAFCFGDFLFGPQEFGHDDLSVISLTIAHEIPGVELIVPGGLFDQFGCFDEVRVHEVMTQSRGFLLEADVLGLEFAAVLFVAAEDMVVEGLIDSELSEVELGLVFGFAFEGEDDFVEVHGLLSPFCGGY